MDLCDKNQCTGCTACMSICPKKAITMQEDKEGFEFPYIDKIKCIDCQMCKNICPVNKSKTQDCISFYACQLKYEKALMDSTSGGAFYAFAEYVLQYGGIVYAVGSNQNGGRKIYRRINKIEDLVDLQGTEYYQIPLRDTLEQVKKDLKNGSKVLFVGIPCAVDGLKNYIGNNDNLLCIDILCHGCPSFKFYNIYISELQKKYRNRIAKFIFRSKYVCRWDEPKKFNVILDTKKGVREKSMYDFMSYYGIAFNNGYIQRRSCYTCKYTSKQRIGDISIGDFWGIKKQDISFDIAKGVSLVMINTKEGERTFKNVMPSLVFNKIDNPILLNHNSALNGHIPELSKLQYDNRLESLETVGYKLTLKNLFNCKRDYLLYLKVKVKNWCNR